jgi:branched-chain amino acid transport system substrate-binding protein
MRKSLRLGAVSVVAAAVTLTGFASAASANTTRHAKPTFTIAYEGPLSGGVAQLGLNMDYAVRLAIQQANAGTTFGALPFTLKYLRKDDQGSPTVSPTIAAQLVANKNVIAVVGPAFSGATKAAEPTFHAAQLATVSPSATAIALAQNHWNNFFRVVASDQIQGTADANYAVMKQHFHKIYVVGDGSTYGNPLASIFAGQARKDGASANATPVTIESTAACGNGGTGDDTEYPGAAAKIVSAHPALVFYGGYYCDLGLLLGALHSAGYHGKVMSGDGSDDPHLITGTKPHAAANGVFLSCACAVLGKTAADKAFATGFTKLAHFAPGTYSAESYDAANAIILALKNIATRHGVGAITRANVVNALHSVVWVGLTKTVKFQANGNIAGTTVYVNQVQGNKIVQLGKE